MNFIKKSIAILMTISLMSATLCTNVFAGSVGGTNSATAPKITTETTPISLTEGVPVVFKFVPTDPNVYTIKVIGGNDQVMSLHDTTDYIDPSIHGDYDTAGNCLVAGDDENGLQPEMSYLVTPGKTYYIIVYEYEQNQNQVYDSILSISGGGLMPLNIDATLKASPTIKGETVTDFGSPSATLGSETAGDVTITAAQAADTSNATTFVTLFEENDTNATVKAVKYASGTTDFTGFDAATAYTDAAITDGDFFIVRVTAEDGTTINYYRINVAVTPAGSSDATLKASSTVKGVTATLGTPNATLGSATPGAVTITAAQAADTSNGTTFVTLFDKNDTNATVKAVKYASGTTDFSGFDGATEYTNAAITNGDFFIVKVTAEDGTTILYYRINVTVTVAPSTAKAITAFDFNGLLPAVTGTVDEGAKTIALTVPYGTNVTALVPTITHTGASVSPNTGVAQDFTNPVTYTVTAADSNTQEYTVTVTVAPSTAKAITAFDFNGLSPAVTGTVDEGAKTIALTVPYGTNVTALVPTITHTGASVSPNTGVAQDFTNPVTYTVTAADSNTQEYTVTVTVAPSTAKAITAFDFNGLSPAVTGIVDEGAKTIALTVPYGTDVTTLVPTITHTGASVSPNTGVAQDFTNPVTYTVTAADSNTQEYMVTVTVAPSIAKAITAFDFNGLSPAVTGTVDEGAKTVTLTVPYGTDVTALVPTITHTGASVSPNKGVAQDFTNPVTYTVTAADSNTQAYTVTVTVAPSTAKAITAFDFNGLSPAVTGIVDEGAKTIALTVPYGTNVTALVPTITHTGASVSPNTGVAQDFTNPVTYTVTAADSSEQQYTVTVTVAPSTAKAITAFDFNGLSPAVTGTVDEGAKTIALTVPYGTNVTALIPTITHTGASVSPNTGVAQDFTNPVTYTVTAADSSEQQYTVTVTVAPSTAKAIIAFDFNALSPAVTGTVDEGAKTVTLTVPYGTDVTALVPTITHTGASVSPNTGVAQDFTNPVTYTVTAADSNTQAYTVTVTVAPSTAKAITAFDFNGLSPAVTGIVDEGAKTIALTVPYGTNVTALVPTITHTGASVSPNTGVAQDFTSPVAYTVTAADSNTQEYMVTVTVAPSIAKAITAFDFNGLSPAVTGTVDEGAKTIALTVPYGTDVTTLVPTITHTGASVSPNTGVAQDFTNPVTYTVTAADSNTQEYTVTVTKAANPAKAITAFDFNGLSPAVTGTVDEGAKTIALTVPYGTNVTALVPTITHTGASVSPNTGVAQDFTSPVAYTVTAADSNTQEYMVTVTVAPSIAKAITAFDFNGLSPAVTGTVDEGAKTIALTVPYGTDVTTLVPTITHTGASVSPNTGVAQDFTNPVTYTVTAADSNTQEYTVTVMRALASNAELLGLSLSSGTLAPAFANSTTSYTASVAHGVSSITLTPTVADHNAAVTVNGITVPSGNASGAINLSVGANAITVVVTAQDGKTTKTYAVTVTRAASSGGSSGGGGGGSSSTTTTQPSQNTVVVVNGKEQNAGKETQKTEDGKSTVTVSIDNKAVESKIDDAIKTNSTGIGNVIQVQVADTKSEVAKVELTGDIVKKLEENTFDVSVKRDNVEYVIPAEEFTISKVAENLGLEEKKLADIKVEVKITKLDEKVIEKYNEVAKINGAELVFPPVQFEIVARTTKTDGTMKEQSINKFSNYVERVLEIPVGIDPGKITTGIVFNADGTYSHVPTEVYEKDGKWYAKLNSLTNSDYSVIWNPVTVKSVENHWAKDAVNDMASRLVIFNPEEFEPDKAITRADFAEYIVRALGLYREGSKHENKFKDVTASGERTLGILIANEYGIVSGYSDGTFRGDNQVTREEAMAMYQRAMKITKLVGSDENRYQNYTDYSQVSDWAKTNVKSVLSAHVFNGTTPTKISPKATLTNAEAAQAIRNLLIESKLISQ